MIRSKSIKDFGAPETEWFPSEGGTLDALIFKMVETVSYRNPVRLGLVKELERVAKREDTRIWSAVAEALSKSRRNRPEVNVYRLDKNTSDGDVVVVPGSVVGSGKLTHKVDVAAFKFTEGARREIISAGGKVLSIPELMKENSKGSGVKIIS